MVDVIKGNSAPIFTLSLDGLNSAYPQVSLLDTSGSLIATITLSYTGHGVYLANHTFPTAGYFITVFNFFTDGTYTSADTTYSPSSDLYLVSEAQAAIQHTNRIGTSFSAGVHEILAWSETDGQVEASPTACTVTIKTAAGVTAWAATATAPNADGVYRFTNTIVLLSNSDYYVVIAITVNNRVITSIVPFITVG